MKMMKLKSLMVFFSILLMAFGVLADAKSEAHARRKARKNSVAAIVKGGDASEGSNGYLIPKKGLAKEKRAVVVAENKDRKIGYEAIAKQHNTSVEAISKAAGKINQKKAKGK